MAVQASGGLTRTPLHQGLGRLNRRLAVLEVVLRYQLEASALHHLEQGIATREFVQGKHLIVCGRSTDGAVPGEGTPGRGNVIVALLS